MTPEAAAQKAIAEAEEKKRITFPAGSVEEFFHITCNMNPKIVKLKHELFSMRIENDELLIDMDKRVSQHMYYEDYTNDESLETINYIDFILSQHTQDAFGEVSRRANRFRLSDYDIDDFHSQFSLMCLYTYEFYMYKFRDIKSIDDIDRPIPTQLFVSLLTKTKNLEVLYKDVEGNEFAGKLMSARVAKSMFSMHLEFVLGVVSKSKSGYSLSNVMLDGPMIGFAEKVEDLGLTIITPEIKARLTERGRKYVEYTKNPTYCFYNGFGFKPGGWFGDVRTAINGRIMVDHMAMRILNSNLDDSWYIGNLFDDSDCSKDVQESALWMCSPVVYGFAFSSKEWARMQIENVSQIAFSNTALDELIVKESYKDIFMACLKHEMPSLDSIEGKGNGRIFLLYGPPGVGKTMTAEAVAEYTQQPLYYVSVGELGISPESMEHNLGRVMQVAQSWNAIVLLDEVDVFAVKRTGSDIQRNAMTAILLRLLERFSGIMFMTTNLLDNLDEAFISRATATIPYDALTTSDRVTIWTSLLKKAEKSGATVDKNVYDNVRSLAGRQLNGRTIKNNVRLAFSIAVAKNDRNITMDILKSVMDIRTA